MPLEFPARLIRFNQRHILTYGPPAPALGETLIGPPLVLRPGYRFHFRDDYLLPTEIIDDLGQHLPAPACYDWLEQRGDAYPRADVLGQLASTGQNHSAFVKELDLIEQQIYVMGNPPAFPPARADLAVELLPPPDGLALVPQALPIPAFARALTCYRLHPNVPAALRDLILTRLLTTRRDDWQLTFDELHSL